MATLFTDGKFQGFDSNGAPLSGGKLYSYSAGTLTPIVTYTTVAGNVPNANPTTLDAAGRASVYLGSEAYRLILKDAAGSTVWDVDNVTAQAVAADLSASSGSSLVGFIQAGTGAVARTAQAKMRETVSVLDFGATGDGVTDDTAAIQAAITAAYGQTLIIPEGTYNIQGGLTITDSITIVVDPGAVLDYSSATAGTALDQKKAISITGSVGTAVALTADIDAGDRQISFDTTGFAAGDWVLIKSAQEFMDGVTSYAVKRGHISRIKSVDSGTAATLTERSPFAYAYASTGTVSKLTLVNKVTIRGGAIIGGGTGYAHSAISASHTLDLHVDGVAINGCEDCGVRANYSVRPIIEACKIEDCTSPGGSVGNTGYGVVFGGGTRNGIARSNRFKTCRHPISGGGGVAISLFCQILDNYSEDGGIGTDGYDCHEPCFWWTFDGNQAHGGLGGFLSRGQYITLSNNEAHGVEGEGIVIKTFISNTDGVNGAKIIGNRVSNCGGSGISLEGVDATNRINNAELIGNDVRNCATFNVRLEFVDGVQIIGGQYIGTSDATGTSGTGIRTVGTVAGDNKNITIGDVRIADQQRHGIRLEYTQGATISVRRISNVGLGTTGNAAVSLAFADDVDIGRGVYESTNSSVQGVIHADTCQNLAVIGATLIGAAGNTDQDGVRWYSTAGTNSGGRFIGVLLKASGRYGIYSTDSDHIVAIGNDVSAATSATKLSFAAAADTQVANNLT